MTTLSDSGPQGWGAYGSVLAAMAVALALPLLMYAGGRLIGLWSARSPSEQRPTDQQPAPHPRQIAPSDTLNTRYFSAMMMAGLMTMPLFLLLPFVGGTQADLQDFSTLATLSISICAGAALVYANRKSDLKWNGETTPERSDQGEGE